ncbi:protein RRP5 homolog [Ambystoma mexicanum]|uniref:protein RRP5 homolog n=1 Tax=Ambystoma mexicanum TaxID=8296 RepID=UPI0037E7FEBE
MSFEESFPRGGTQKKPKETETHKSPVDRDNLFNTHEDGAATTKRKKTKGDSEKPDHLKSKKPKTEGNETSASKKDEKWIEILKFNNISTGLLLLGCVKQATEFELIVSLPHGLTGFVQVTNICEAYTKLLSDQVETEELSSDLAPLSELYFPGMLVRCCVSSLDVTKGGFHSLKLSLNPKDVNKALNPESLKTGMLLSGCVSSVEDHGYLIDIGVGGTKAFLPRQKAQSYMKQSNKGAELKIGQYLNCLLEEVKDNGRIVCLSVNHSDIMASIATKEQKWTLQSLLPGLVVKGQVQKVGPDGITVSFLSSFTGTVDFLHLDPKRSDGYQIEQMVKACIIYVHAEAKIMGLSLRQPFLQPGNPLRQLSSDLIGNVVKQCPVKFFHKNSGVLFQLDSANLAFAHMHNMPCKSKYLATLKNGSKHTGRIVDYSPMDEMLLMSLKQSVIEMPYLRYQDIQPGQIIEGTVSTLRPFGIIVKITDHLTGLVPSMHLADVRIKKPEKKYSEGQPVKCRVLTVFPEAKKLILTLKKTLIDSSLPVISSYLDAKPGMTVHGFIARVKDFGCLVQFYNDVRGLVPRSELSTEPVPFPEEVFYEGQVVKVAVLNSEPEKERMKLSLKLTVESFTDNLEISPQMKERARKYEIGKVFDVTVVKKSETGLEVSILPEGIPAFLPTMHLSDHVTNSKLLWHCLQKGDFLPRVMCLSNAQGQIILCRKPSLMTAIEDGDIAKDISEIHSGMLFAGYVKSVMPYGVFVEFPHGLCGLAPKSAMCDKFVTNTEDHFVAGQTVMAKVTNTDEEKKRILLNLKLSECRPDDCAAGSFSLLNQCIKEIIFVRNIMSSRDESDPSQNLAKLLPGQKLTLVVHEVNDDGSAFFSGGEATVGTTVFASPFHVGETSLVPGQKATMVVLYVDGLQSKVYVSLRPELLTKKVKELLLDSTESAVVQHVAEEFAVVSLVETGQLAAIPVASHLNDTYRFDSEKLTVGQAITVTLKTVAAGEYALLLAVRGPVTSRTNKKPWKKLDVPSAALPAVMHDLSFGDTVTATVKSVKPTSVLVSISDKIVGCIHVSEILDEVPVGIFPTSRLKVKQTVTAKVIGARDIKTHRCLPITHPEFSRSVPELSIRPSVLKSDGNATLAPSEANLVGQLNSYKPGQCVTCYVRKYNLLRKSLEVAITPEIHGRIDQTLLSLMPRMLKHPEKQFKLGQALSATVIGPDVSQMCLHLSLTGVYSLANGTILLGSVKKVIACIGLTITLPFGKTGNASLLDLSDSYSETPLSNFSAGKVVRCYVLSTDDQRTDVSLRPSRTNPKCSGKVVDVEITSIADLHEGQLLRGYVESVREQGVFISISASVVGRVQFKHASKFFVNDRSVYEKYIQAGKLLTAKVLSVDHSEEHVALSLLTEDTGKPDLIPESLGLPLRKTSKLKEKDGPDKLKKKRKRGNSESDQKVTVPKKKKTRAPKEEDDSGVEVYFREQDDDATTQKKSKPKKAAPVGAARLQTSSSFAWDVGLNSLKGSQPQKPEAETSDSDEDEDEEEQQSKQKKKTKKDKEMEKQQAEKELSKIEATLMDPTRPPLTADEFDRLVLSSPNSSILWLQYMAFHLHATEIEKARAVAERALKTISFREEQEKLNVWVAFLNLENLYGTEETLMKVFERAVQYNEPLKVFMQLADVYAKSEKFKQADDLYNTMLKRFRKEKSVWLKYATYLLKQGETDSAHRLLQRALKCLPDKEHVDVISKFAQLEFHLGDVERAKSIFESTLSNYPKRTDLWSVYIDMMIKHGSQKEVRTIFERVIHLSLAAKRMKFFFKRYLEYEKKHGSQETVQAVKEKALEYVETKRTLVES